MNYAHVATFNGVHWVRDSNYCRWVQNNVFKAYFREFLLSLIRRMAENGFAPPPREFRRHILSCRELKAEYFKRCLHSVLRGVSL